MTNSALFLPADNLGRLKQAILQDLGQALGSRVRSLDTHAGAFESTEARRFALLAPAIRIAVTQWQGFEEYGSEDQASTLVRAQVVLSILARDESADRRRDVVALELAQEVMLQLLAGSYLDPERLGSRVQAPLAHDITARALYDSDTDRAGLAIWSIEAPYIVDLTALPASSDLTLKSVWLGHHPQVGTRHLEDYLELAAADNSES